MTDGNQYPTRNEVESFFSDLNARWRVDKKDIGESREFLVSSGNKSITFLWEPDVPDQFWFLITIDGKNLYTAWYDIWEDETKKELFDYTLLFSERFFNHEIRIKRMRFFFAHYEPQYYSNGEWMNLRAPS